MKKRVIRMALASVALAAASTTLTAQGSAGATGGAGVSATIHAGITVKEATPGLLKLAKIAPDAAMATAQARVPTGQIESGEIEKEDGKLQYAFDIKIAGKSGIEEVAVDAMTGKVLSVEHETPAQIEKERKADSVEAAKAKAKAAAARGRGGV